MKNPLPGAQCIVCGHRKVEMRCRWVVHNFFSWNIQTNKSNRISTITSNKHQEIDVASACGPVLQLIHWARSVAILFAWGHILPVQNFTRKSPKTLGASAAPGFRAKPWLCSKNWSKTLVQFGYQFEVDPPMLSQKCLVIPKPLLYRFWGL